MNTRIRRWCLSWMAIIFLPAVGSPHSVAQVSAKRTQQFNLVSIQVAGNKHYSSRQIVDVSGLKVGQSVSDDGKTVNEEIFREAAKHIGETGAFTDVRYQYQYSNTGTKLEFQVSESEKFVTAQFDNFVWFTDDELLTTLESRVPLFEGTLPASGTIPERVAQVLQQMLTDHQIPGSVDFLLTDKQGGPLTAIKYSVTGMPIRIHETTFPGTTPEELPLLQAAAQPLQGQEYSRSMLRVQKEKVLLPIYLAHGYLKAKFADPQAKVAHFNADYAEVDVSFPVSTGEQYKVKDVQWTGNTLFPPEKLQSLIHLKAGMPANAVQLEQDLGSLRQLYGTRGYITAEIITSASFDDSASTVDYALNVLEGDQYRMGTLELHGLDPKTKEAVTAAWKLRSGEPYDAGYLHKQFFEDLLKAHISIPGDLVVKGDEKINADAKTVDVTVTFTSKRPS